MSSQLNRPTTDLEAQSSNLFDRTFRDSQGNIVIAQPPNLPLILGLTTALLAFFVPAGNLQIALNLISFGVWFTWAWQEIFGGVNYFRRGLGALVLVGIVVMQLKLAGL